MSYLLFFIYLILLCWLLTKIKFLRNSGLNNRILILLFLLRVFAGLANGWINVNYFSVSDSLGFHENGIKEYHLLFNNIREYLLNIFYNNHKSSDAGFLDITDSYWNDLRSNIIAKLLSIFNILSRGNYFINILFYNFLVFFGVVALYKIFADIFSSKKNILIISVFLLPSTLYFTSAIHRDGLIFLALGIVCYNMYYVLRKERLNVKRALYILAGMGIIFLLRNFVFITLLPALTAWIIADKRKKFVLQTFILTYLFFGLLFFSLKFLHPKLDLPQYVSNRQIAFISLSKKSSSAINVNPLFPNFRSFFNNSPQALNHSLMRPYLTDDSTLFYIPVAIEIFMYEILLVLFLLFPVAKKTVNGFIYFGVFFSLCMCLIIGYTIPILGAIVRYRSIYFPFLITPIACMLNIQKLKALIYKKNR